MLKRQTAQPLTIRNYPNISDNIGHFTQFFVILPNFSPKKPIFKDYT